MLQACQILMVFFYLHLKILQLFVSYALYTFWFLHIFKSINAHGHTHTHSLISEDNSCSNLNLIELLLMSLHDTGGPLVGKCLLKLFQYQHLLYKILLFQDYINRTRSLVNNDKLPNATLTLNNLFCEQLLGRKLNMNAKLVA